MTHPSRHVLTTVCQARGGQQQQRRLSTPGTPDIRRIKTRVIRVSKGRDKWADEAAASYGARIALYTPFEEVTVKPVDRDATGPDAVEAIRRAESERVLKLMSPGDCLVALDERGRDLSSRAFADLVSAAAEDTSRQALSFVIGGPYGHHESLREAATYCIRVSGLVLNHQVARVVLLEQIYRAWTILRGEPYHHE